LFIEFGQRQMARRRTRETIDAGQTAPSFALQDVSGDRFSLAEALARGPVVATFFKISCPVCQFTLPFLERLYKTYRGDRVSFWAISQDDARDTEVFCKEYGVTFPALLDEDGYPVSNSYGLTNVPTYFLIAPDGKIEVASVGFGKRALEKISESLARFLGVPRKPFFLPGEIVPEAKPG
jgi:peroxiredoxin